MASEIDKPSDGLSTTDADGKHVNGELHFQATEGVEDNEEDKAEFKEFLMKTWGLSEADAELIS